MLPTKEAKAATVQDMFSAIAPRYDLLNHLLSLNIDKRWRRRAVDILLRDNDPGGSYLDACAGTMDLAVEISKRGPRVLASDFAYPMLANGRHKIAQRNVTAVCGDAMRLPFPDDRFAGVIVGFGVRNLAAVEEGIVELTRVLRPGGKLVILEFTTPGWQPFRALYLTYFRHVLPAIGKLISKHNTAYSYLPASVLEFPEPRDLATLMKRAGLSDVQWETRTGGIVAIHSGRK